MLLFIIFSVLYFSILNNSSRIYTSKLNKTEEKVLDKLVKQHLSILYNDNFTVYKLNLLNNKNTTDDIIEIDENNIHTASLILESGSKINILNWVKYKPTGEFKLNTKPYFKINKTNLNAYLLISGDTYQNIAFKQFDYSTFAESKNTRFLIRIINMMILLGIILASLYVYLKLRNGYSFFFFFYMLLMFCSNMLYNGFTNDFWPFNYPYFADHSLSLGLGIHLVMLSIFILFYLKKYVINRKLIFLSMAFLAISLSFLILGFFFTSYLLLRYEVWFSCLISFVFLLNYSNIFKAYQKKDAYWFNYLSIICYVLLSLVYSIKYFSFFTPSILFELLQKNLFLGHISCLFFAFILINKKKLLSSLITEDELQAGEAYSDFEENNFELSQLSNREYKVLELIADGLKDQEIANQLFITIATVKTHKQRIYRKLNINNKLQAAQIYSEFNSKVINF
ncbi:MAG: response regulator transcription factor [Bacteroidetes bacterium]|nr:response regulator transcription factor [Bacteroidota bacterium]MBU1484143.1 response regulator transcription factor [Bacteroidota bacterium]MBU2267516.1 response regulator transcription factor [Bacteroidota bacterium]MBU2376939.1 response regulator transcription factor [Bacteroidota bacterium]